MADHNPFSLALNGRWLFLRQFFRHPLQIGSIIPSSRYLERRIVNAAGVESAGLVVELGPGTGGTTRALLAAMPAGSTLVSIELNPRFHAALAAIDDPRLVAHLGSARHVAKILADLGLGPVDAVVSGIPFSTMSPALGAQILQAVAAVLAPEGRFVAYQWSRRVADLGRPILGPARAAAELRNIPPMRVYQWQARGA